MKIRISKYYESILFFKCPCWRSKMHLLHTKYLHLRSVCALAFTVLELQAKARNFSVKDKMLLRSYQRKEKKVTLSFFLRLAGSLNRLIDRDIFLTKATTCSVPKVRLLDKGECLFHFMHKYRIFFIKRIVLSPRQVFYLLMW